MKTTLKTCAGKGKYRDFPGCGLPKVIFSNGLCADCARRAASFLLKSKNPVSVDRTDHPKQTPLKSPKNKPESLTILFDLIWNERPHVSEVSGKPLLPRDHPQWHWQMSHILSKGAYPKFRARKDNIKLVLPQEHHDWEFARHRIKDLTEWKWVFELEEKLKIEYFQK